MSSMLNEALKNCNHLMTTTEVAKLTSISSNNLAWYAKKGLIPHIRVGKTYKFDPLALLEWLEQKSHALTQEQLQMWLADRGYVLSPDQMSLVWETLSHVHLNSTVDRYVPGSYRTV
jgi:excisionase family DNA binding protein